MTQEPVRDHGEDLPSGLARADEQPDEERVRTGHERVDSVVAAIEQLRDLPVDEHVAAFEQAHDELRRALDDVPPDDPA
jgi:hypothetical protein